MAESKKGFAIYRKSYLFLRKLLKMSYVKEFSEEEKLEIKTKIAEILSKDYDSEPHEIVVRDGVIELERMYQYVTVTFKQLTEIAKVLGTDEINLSNGESYGGCESCDYGSSYTVELKFTYPNDKKEE